MRKLSPQAKRHQVHLARKGQRPNGRAKRKRLEAALERMPAPRPTPPINPFFFS